MNITFLWVFLVQWLELHLSIFFTSMIKNLFCVALKLTYSDA